MAGALALGLVAAALDVWPARAQSAAQSSFESLLVPDGSLPNLAVVTPGLVRGGQPTMPGLARLKAAGVKTIVNLRNEDLMIRREGKVAHQLGLKYVSIPLDEFSQPADRSIRQFLKVANDPSRQPVYVHCLHGQDRTGTMVAIYRIQEQGWNASQAYQEMLSFGFRPFFVNLSNAVFDYGQRLGRPGVRPSGGLIVDDLKSRLSRFFGQK